MQNWGFARDPKSFHMSSFSSQDLKFLIVNLFKTLVSMVIHCYHNTSVFVLCVSLGRREWALLGGGGQFLGAVLGSYIYKTLLSGKGKNFQFSHGFEYKRRTNLETGVSLNMAVLQTVLRNSFSMLATMNVEWAQLLNQKIIVLINLNTLKVTGLVHGSLLISLGHP